MIGFWSPVIGWLKQFFTLWGEALLAGLPERVRKRFVLSRDPKHVELETPSGLAGLKGISGHDLDIELKDQLALVHEVRLPQAAISEIGKVVRLEADRVMPINTRELYVAHEIVGKNADGTFNVTLVAVRRVLVDQLLRQASQLGLTIRSLVVGATGVKVPVRISEIQVLKAKRISALLFAICLVFVLALQIPKFYFDHLVEGITEADQAIRAARKDTAKIAGLQNRVDALQDLSSAVKAVKTEGQILELFSVLTSLSPDDVRIDEFRLDGRRLYLGGRATTPEEWVIQLQKHNAFEDVRLTSVLGQPQQKLRRFEVHMKVLWPEERPTS